MTFHEILIGEIYGILISAYYNNPQYTWVNPLHQTTNQGELNAASWDDSIFGKDYNWDPAGMSMVFNNWVSAWMIIPISSPELQTTSF